jgi:hypothetical protein
MPDFSQQGYFTLDQLDKLQNEVRDLKQRIEGTLKAFRKGTGDLVHFKIGRKGGKNSGMFVPLTDIGIDVTRTAITKLDNGEGMTIKFGQDFTDPPIVVASIESSERFAAVVSKVGIKEVTINFYNLGKGGKGGKDREDYLNVIAFGKTKN